MKNEIAIIKTEYLPDVKREDLRDFNKVLKTELPNFGLTTKCDGKGLYKCYFPNGVSGTLAKKNGANLGAIMGEKGGIVGQARWVEQTFDPTMVMVAAALHNIEEKLESIEKVQKEIFEYEQIKDESEMENNAKYLTYVLRDYQHNVGNDEWIKSKTIMVESCFKDAGKYIAQYRKLVGDKALKTEFKDKLLHTSDDADKKINEAIRYLSNYQKAAYLYAFSQYVHIILTKSYDENYLNDVSNDIGLISSEYRDVFTTISVELEKYLKGSIDLNAIKVVGKAIDGLGDVSAKIPLLNKTKAEDTLKYTGVKMQKSVVDGQLDRIKKLANHSQASLYQFRESINNINELNYKNVELLTDDDYVYYKVIA